MTALWQTPEDRYDLLQRLINHQSVTFSEGEQSFPYLVRDLMMELDYFKERQHQITLEPADDARHSVLVHYKAPTSKQTIVLISHFDTVGVEDFGTHESHAFDSADLEGLFKEEPTLLNQESLKDFESGDYIFGRGVMDMKAGLMLHMSLIEKAIREAWDVNLVLVTVPDEEVNSLGMRTAVKALRRIKEAHDLEIKLHLNGEPTFQQASDDNSHYAYTGTIGKLMPAVLCYGRETHVGNPLNGVSSNFMFSFVNQEMEYNTAFQEEFEGEVTPLPLSLMNTNLKHHYDVQTPFRTIGLYNVFTFKETPETVYAKFQEIVKKAAKSCETRYQDIMTQANYDMPVAIKVLSYKELKAYATKKLGADAVNAIIDECLKAQSETHMQSIHIVDTLMHRCREIGPAMVTFFAPPYYPSVNTSYNGEVESILETIRTTSAERFNRESKRLHYFNGICDLSYVRKDASLEDIDTFVDQTPVYNYSYEIAADDIEAISAPVLNCGPIGKDAHKISERLHKESAFNELPVILESIVKKHFI
ncbi:M20/M25/M40 family metallo-hydrolase [Staphylococcus massiliensis]|uniref:M20/M25/M40 family metallo-hydrolase n=1 Tax=Staphylococcus massiliensis TaxID=555791 RepID=UPI001EDD443B|nr:M20/M25/M40 family metallo-hydrolase [Staphylococcus massiliensis]MCG3411713.1 M20/M25/M40 family metallo-hydrolase [Staphylococcus massiliensis]